MTLTIEIAPNDWNRISEAFGVMLGLDHDATDEELTAEITKHLGRSTQSHEQNEYNKQFVPPPFETPGL